MLLRQANWSDIDIRADLWILLMSPKEQLLQFVKRTQRRIVGEGLKKFEDFKGIKIYLL